MKVEQSKIPGSPLFTTFSMTYPVIADLSSRRDLKDVPLWESFSSAFLYELCVEERNCNTLPIGIDIVGMRYGYYLQDSRKV